MMHLLRCAQVLDGVHSLSLFCFPILPIFVVFVDVVVVVVSPVLEILLLFFMIHFDRILLPIILYSRLCAVHLDFEMAIHCSTVLTGAHRLKYSAVSLEDFKIFALNALLTNSCMYIV